jgi:lipoprotein NlpI
MAHHEKQSARIGQKQRRAAAPSGIYLACPVAIERSPAPIYRYAGNRFRAFHDQAGQRGSPMSANSGSGSGSWLAAHGKLWYDDRWYRIAWIVWPQAIGLLLFVTLWLFHPTGQGFAPWGKPVAEKKDPPLPAPAPPPKPQPQPLNEQTSDVLAPCKGEDYAGVIQACTALLTSGNLRGENIARGYWHRGWAYLMTKQYQLAMSDYNRAISIAPGIPEFYNERGLTWIDLENNERAMQDFDQAILLKSDYAYPYMNRGVALRNLKRPNEALTALTKAVSLDANLWWAYENRAFIYEEREDWRAMYNDANKLIELKPEYRMGYEFRGHAYLEAGQYQAAINDFTKAIDLDSQAIYGWRMRGRAYYYLNQFDNAMSDLQAALRIDPQDNSTISFINDVKRKRR